MFRNVMSRSQRRLEKRQAVTLLLLVFAVSLVSFSLGVMVGKRGSGSAGPAPAPAVTRAPGAPARLPVAQGVTLPAGGSAAPAAAPAKDLTFYDSLPRGQQPPLGSGINLPPAGAVSPSPPPAEKAAAPAPAPPSAQPVSPPPALAATAKTAAPAPAAQPAVAPAPAPAPVKAAPAAATGSYILQVASFPKAADAKAMQDRLARGGYPVYTRQADLGAKGIWYRVFIGPYPNVDAANAAAGRLKSSEKLSVLVRKE